MDIFFPEPPPLSKIPLRPARFLTVLAFIVLPFALNVRQVSGWSSYSIMDANKTYFGTHQRFNRLAYERLGLHPILGPEALNHRNQRMVDFPTLEEIQGFAFVSKTGSGPGPDDKENSCYSEHYFNPKLNPNGKGIPQGAGGAPEAVKDHFQNLKIGLENDHLISEKKPFTGNNARDAAYAAHYAQDMTCPFHVLGQPIKELKNWKRRQPGKEVIGPFGLFLDERWQQLVLYAAKDARDPNTDWLEANYYDGFEPAGYINPVFSDLKLFTLNATLFSTHFAYEFRVENYCHADSVCSDERKWVPQWEKKEGWILPFWTGSEGIEESIKKLAKETRDCLDAEDSELAFSRHNIVINMPYKQWWRAIQATYTLWRSSFSALYVDLEDIELSKVPKEPQIYNLRVRVNNYEPQTAAGVKLEYRISGDRNVSGSGTLGDIPMWSKIKGPGTAFRKFSDTRIRLQNPDDPQERDGILRIAVSGRFQEAPDPGAVFEYYFKDIGHDALEMIRLEGRLMTPAEALKLLQEKGLKKENIRIQGSGTSGKKLRVRSQDPQAGTWISPDEAVTLVLEELESASISTGGKNAALEKGMQGDCSALRKEYTSRFTEMVAFYQDRSCEIANYTSGCRQNVAGFIAAYISDAFADRYCSDPLFVQCGKDFLDEYYGCLRDCNEKWPREIKTQGKLRDCQAVCNQAAGAAKNKCLSAAKTGSSQSVAKVLPPQPAEDRCRQLGLALSEASEKGDIGLFRSLLPQAKGCAFHGEASDDLNAWEWELYCGALEKDLKTAIANDDLEGFRSLLAGGKECEVYAEGLEVLRDWKQRESVRERCAMIESEILSARDAGEIGRFREVLGTARGCEFFEDASRFLQDWEQDVQRAGRCDQLFSVFERSFYENDFARCGDILDQARDCSFHAEAAGLLDRAAGFQKRRADCGELGSALNRAYGAGDAASFRFLLDQARDCAFYGEALADLQDLERRAGGGGFEAGPIIGRCDEVKRQGSDRPETHIIELGKTSGSFLFEYQTYTRKDRIVLVSGHRQLFDSGCVGTNGWRSVNVPFSDPSSTVMVEIFPNCAGESDTRWEFIVHCP